MAETTEIAWTDATFNPWIGCSKVHAGCTHCYAEADMDTRRGRVTWGINGTRSLTSPDYWKKPLLWNKKAAAAGVRTKVFCASLADVFEDWEGGILDHQGVSAWRKAFTTELPMIGEKVPFRMADVRRNLFELIDATPHLIWLILTKRPENVQRMWLNGFGVDNPAFNVRKNVWLGTSPCDQATADKSIPELLKCRDLCGGLFLSCEPLLGSLSFRWAKWQPFSREPGGVTNEHDGLRRLDWVIVGGESGHGARPMHPQWVRSIRDQCQAAGVPFFFKQWGRFAPYLNERHISDESDKIKPHLWSDSASGDSGSAWVLNDDGDWDNWTGSPPVDEHGRVVESVVVMGDFGTKFDGREIDGREWSEFPASFAVPSEV